MTDQQRVSDEQARVSAAHPRPSFTKNVSADLLDARAQIAERDRTIEALAAAFRALDERHVCVQSHEGEHPRPDWLMRSSLGLLALCDRHAAGHAQAEKGDINLADVRRLLGENTDDQ